MIFQNWESSVRHSVVCFHLRKLSGNQQVGRSADWKVLCLGSNKERGREGGRHHLPGGLTDPTSPWTVLPDNKTTSWKSWFVLFCLANQYFKWTKTNSQPQPLRHSVWGRGGERREDRRVPRVKWNSMFSAPICRSFYKINFTFKYLLQIFLFSCSASFLTNPSNRSLLLMQELVQFFLWKEDYFLHDFPWQILNHFSWSWQDYLECWPRHPVGS